MKPLSIPDESGFYFLHDRNVSFVSRRHHTVLISEETNSLKHWLPKVHVQRRNDCFTEKTDRFVWYFIPLLLLLQHPWGEIRGLQEKHFALMS